MWARSYDRSCGLFVWCIFFFKQKTAYEMRISDWSSDVCSSDLPLVEPAREGREGQGDRAGKVLDGTFRRARGNAHPGDDQSDPRPFVERAERPGKIGRASCRERVCQYV